MKCYSYLNLAISKMLMDLSMRLDYFRTPFATQYPFLETILFVQVNDDLEPLLASMISYGSKCDLECSKGEISTKAFCFYITSLAEKCPDLMFKNAAYVVPFLCCEVLHCLISDMH